MRTTSIVPPPPRKSAILTAALAVFAEKGIESTSIEDICRESQASVGSIYHHFGNKEGIAAALFMQHLDEYWTELITSAKSQSNAQRMIHAMLSAHIGWITSQPDAARYLFSRRQAVSAVHEQAIREYTLSRFRELFDVLKPWFKAGVLRRLPAELYGPLLMGPAQEYAREWLRGCVKLEPRKVIDELALAAWRSLATDPNQSGNRGS
ncbi:MAG: TetR/AcrR family transcriptional regulator [Rhodoferax sp.]|nr:TetR/AcrR family transcriptional regulator [Rhodoferax sp.]